MDRIEAALDLLTADLAILRGAVALTDHHLDGLRAVVQDLAEGMKVTDETARRMWELQTRATEDIARLYEAWPEHLRHPRPNGHGEPA
jgi:hypothetical protein